jgi:hypothetical protein
MGWLGGVKREVCFAYGLIIRDLRLIDHQTSRKPTMLKLKMDQSKVVELFS